jgi:hypothetical protein
MPDDPFKEFVPGQLSAAGVAPAGNVRRAWPLCRRKFPGILDEGRLFFKTGAASAAGNSSGGGKTEGEEEVKKSSDRILESRRI